MFNNNEVKRFLLIIIIFVSSVILTAFLTINVIHNYYMNKLYNNTAYIVNDLIMKHPELERDIVWSIINADNNIAGVELLAKYGIDIASLQNNISEVELKNKITIYYFCFIVVSLVFLITIFLIFIYRRYKAIRGMSSYIDEILNDNYKVDIREYAEGDLSNLKNDIYKVTVKLKEYSDNILKDKVYLADTLSDISHQLKTPLTSMYVINDILATEKDVKIRREFLNKNRNQLERIEWLVTSLLKISRLDSGTVKLKRELINVKELISKALAPNLILLELKNINLGLEQENFKIDGDLNWTVEALVNIIKNAIEHTKEKGHILIKAVDNPIYSEIIIKDDGDGISRKDLPHIFKRFYKANISKDSIGIGLNMAKRIIDLQNGEIKVKSEIGRGTEFIIKFYKNII